MFPQEVTLCATASLLLSVPVLPGLCNFLAEVMGRSSFFFFLFFKNKIWQSAAARAVGGQGGEGNSLAVNWTVKDFYS